MRILTYFCAVALIAALSATVHAQTGDGSGVFSVQLINTTGTNPGNDTGNWLNTWTALDGGAGPTGVVAGYNIQFNSSDTETVFDYDPGGDFGVNNSLRTINSDGPGGGPGPYPANDNNDAAGDFLALDAFYYEGGGGDSGEISIASGTFANFTNTTDFNLLQDGVLGIAVHSALAVPEPTTIAIWSLLGLALAGFGYRRWRK